MDNKELLEVKEKPVKKENKRGLNFRDMTAFLSFILGGVATYELFKTNFFICDNWIQVIVIAIVSTIFLFRVIYSLCKQIVKNSK